MANSTPSDAHGRAQFDSVLREAHGFILPKRGRVWKILNSFYYSSQEFTCQRKAKLLQIQEEHLHLGGEMWPLLSSAWPLNSQMEQLDFLLQVTLYTVCNSTPSAAAGSLIMPDLQRLRYTLPPATWDVPTRETKPTV